MREIRFRARHKETGEWYHGSSSITDINQGDEHCLTLSLFWLQVERGWLDIKTVGQYTNLPDKNGKEIYEGDLVVRYYWNNSDKKWLPLTAMAVEYHGDRFVLVLNPDLRYTLDFLPNQMEVIGNIYENKELLNELPKKGSV